MKYLIKLFLLLILIFFGCERGGDITSPENESNSVQILPDIPDSVEVIPWPYPPNSDSIFIMVNLLPPEIPNLEESQIIDGEAGGRIDLNYEYQDSLNNTISIYASLEFPKDAFVGTKEITMTLNNDNGTVSFYPHMVFDNPVDYTIEYRGIDLSSIDPHSVDFIFQNYGGPIEKIYYTELRVDVGSGELDLNKAHLYHFSRYGFVN